MDALSADADSFKGSVIVIRYEGPKVGGAVDPMKSTFKAPGSKLLKLEQEKLLSNFAFKFNLRRYTQGGPGMPEMLTPTSAIMGRGLHSFTFQLHVSAFCGIGGAFSVRLGGV